MTAKVEGVCLLLLGIACGLLLSTVVRTANHHENPARPVTCLHLGDVSPAISNLVICDGMVDPDGLDWMQVVYDLDERPSTCTHEDAEATCIGGQWVERWGPIHTVDGLRVCAASREDREGMCFPRCEWLIGDSMVLH